MATRYPARILLKAALFLGLVTSCSGTEWGSEDSEVTSINIGLPDRATLKDKVADIEQQMDGYHLIILSEPDDAQKCTQLSQIGDYTTEAKIEAKLKQGCDYRIRLAIGKKTGGAPAGDGKVTYAAVKPLLEKHCVKCHPGTSVPLDSFASAKGKGDGIIDRIGREAGAAGFMPQGADPLSDEDKAKFAKWKADGYLEKAEAPADDAGAGAPKKLSKTFYLNEEYTEISRDDIKGKTEVKVNITLKLQKDGRDIGLGD